MPHLPEVFNAGDPLRGGEVLVLFVLSVLADLNGVQESDRGPNRV